MQPVYLATSAVNNANLGFYKAAGGDTTDDCIVETLQK